VLRLAEWTNRDNTLDVCSDAASNGMVFNFAGNTNLTGLWTSGDLDVSHGRVGATGEPLKQWTAHAKPCVTHWVS